MEQFAKLLTSIAALVGAVAWPASIIAIIWIFRIELKLTLGKVPFLLDRVKKATLPGVALELERVADAVSQTDAGKAGNITPRQIEAAARITIQKREVGSQALLGELDGLCLEYDSLRRTLPPSADRTRAMTRVLVKMRSLAPSLIDSIDAYKVSGSAGSRLAAVAMMQMVPSVADLTWLKDRFSSEQPFIFYHAALALQNLASNSETPQKKDQLSQTAEEALATVKNFPGIPDQGTIHVLESLLNDLKKRMC